ncbi:lasso RiPP family leader peptide-containing protein [Halorientalis pallida]|uniref:lasso RiPP family leader peptide-containing protein n=1 Tax=Halorientalis pallida TaxID=2479928 RepID=UPI003C6FD097
MSGKETGGYEAPSVTEYGSVESITEAKNKYEIGTDTDIKAINLKGSVGFK